MTEAAINLWCQRRVLFFPESSVPKSEDVCELQKRGVDEDGEGILLEEFGEEHHGLALLSQLPRPQPWNKSSFHRSKDKAQTVGNAKQKKTDTKSRQRCVC